MGKMTVYMLIMGGILLLFYFAGLITIQGTFIGYLLDPQSLMNAGLADQAIAAIFSIGIGGLIVYGLVAGNSPELIAMAGFTTVLLALGWQFIQVYQVVNNSNEFIAKIIFGPIFIIWVLTAIEFWRGRD